MLQRIRDNSSGPLAYTIVGLIVLVFGVWGIGSYFTPSPNQTVATVAGSKISEQALRRAVNQRYRRLRARYGEQFDPGAVSRSDIRRSELAELIRTRLVTQYAKSAGYRINDADVLAVLKQKKAFRKNGQFSVKHYRRVLQRAGIKPARFEAGIRHRLFSRVVETQIRSHAYSMPRGVARIYSRLHEKRRLAILRFDASAWRDNVNVSKQEIKSAYRGTDGKYRIPPRVKLAYVVLDANELEVNAKTGKKHLRDLYEQRKARFKMPAERAGQLIRISIEQDKANEARVRAQKIQKKLMAGRSMAQVAEGFAGVSTRPIELTTRANADQRIAEALFSTRQNQYSNPVHTDDAWFIVKPTGAESASMQPFGSPDVQQTLKGMAKQSARRNAFQARKKKLGKLAFQAPNSLDVIANNMGLDIQHSGWIGAQSGQGIGSHAAVRKVAFSKDVKKKRLNSDVIHLGKSRVAVIHVVDTRGAQKKPLSGVRGQIVSNLKKRQAHARAREAALDIQKKLQAGTTTLSKIASSNPRVTLQKAGLVSRSDNDLDSAVMEAAFSLPHPEGDNAGYTIARTNDGGIVLITVTEAKTPDSPKTKQQERQQEFLAQRQRLYFGLVEYGSFSAWLRSTREVTIHDKVLESAGSPGR